MPSLFQHLLVIGSFQGILLFFLLNLDSKSNTAGRILGTFCLLLALYFLSRFISADGELNSFSFLIGWGWFLPASFGALNYLYYRHAVSEVKLSWKDLIHLAPITTCYLLNLHWITLPAPEKLAIIQNFDPLPSGFKLSFFIFYIQAFVYNGVSAWLIYRYQKKAQNNLANFNPDIFRWLWTFLTLTFVIWCLKVVSHVAQQSSYSIYADILIVVFIYSVAIAHWKNAKLFKIDQLKGTSASIESLPAETSDTKSINNNNGSSGALDVSTRKALADSVNEYMQMQKPYLDNKLTLSGLAEAIGLSNHHLSEVLNQQEGKNFYQFVNEYRIQHLLKLLEKDQSSTVLDLAMASGFSSKSTFNAVFKQFTGKTPSQFRKSLISNS